MHKEKTYFFVTFPFVFLVYAFLLLIVAPGRGAGWMLDDGLFLINAWNVVHGFGLDGMLPQQPNYLINALFMKMGITEILHQRYIYYALWSLSAWTFFSGLTLSRRDSLQIIAIVATLCISYSSVLVGAVFFPLAIGCYFYGSVEKGFRRSALFIFSGFFFAIVAFMHIAFVIAICMILAFIYWIDRSARNSMLMPIFLTSSILLWTIYLNQLGLDRFFTAPAGHETNLLHLMKNAWSVIWFFLSAILAFNFFTFLFRRKGKARFFWAQYSISILLTIFFSLKFFAANFISAFPEIFILFNDRYSTESLLKAHGRVADIPGTIYYLLTFVICRWIAESGYWSIRGCLRHPWESWLTLPGFFREDKRNFHFFIACVGLCLLLGGYAGGSASGLPHIFSAFSGPALGLTFLLWRFIDGGKLGRIPSNLLFLWCSIFLVFAARINLPTLEPIYRSESVTLSFSPFTGIKETARYEEAVQKLKAAYKDSACDSKRLILLDYVPTVHLILQHEAPNQYGVVRPGVYFPEAKLMHDLDSPLGWCALDVTTDETRVMMKEKDVRDAVRARVHKEGQRLINLPSPSADIQPMILYVK